MAHSVIQIAPSELDLAELREHVRTIEAGLEPVNETIGGKMLELRDEAIEAYKRGEFIEGLVDE